MEEKSIESLTKVIKNTSDSNTSGKRGRRVANKKAPSVAAKEEIRTEKEPDKKALKELRAKKEVEVMKEEVNEIKAKRGRSSKKDAVADATPVEGRDGPDL